MISSLEFGIQSLSACALASILPSVFLGTSILTGGCVRDLYYGVLGCALGALGPYLRDLFENFLSR